MSEIRLPDHDTSVSPRWLSDDETETTTPGFTTNFDVTSFENRLSGLTESILESSFGRSVLGDLALTTVPSGGPINWEYELGVATSAAEIIGLIRHFIGDRIADRLYILANSDEDLQPGDRPLSTESLSNFANFLLENRDLKPPLIGLAPNGNIQAEWRGGKQRGLVVQFLPNEMIRYVSVGPNLTNPDMPIRLSGFVPTGSLFSAITPCRVRQWLLISKAELNSRVLNTSPDIVDQWILTMVNFYRPPFFHKSDMTIYR